MKNIIFAILSAMLALTIVSCGDEDEEVSTPKEDVLAVYCDKLVECESPMLAMVGGEAGCEGFLANIMFTEADCAEYDGVQATECVDVASAMSCPDFNAAAEAQDFPPECDAICE